MRDINEIQISQRVSIFRKRVFFFSLKIQNSVNIKKSTRIFSFWGNSLFNSSLPSSKRQPLQQPDSLSNQHNLKIKWGRTRWKWSDLFPIQSKLTMNSVFFLFFFFSNFFFFNFLFFFFFYSFFLIFIFLFFLLFSFFFFFLIFFLFSFSFFLFSFRKILEIVKNLFQIRLKRVQRIIIQ